MKTLRILLLATLPISAFICTAPTEFAITDIDLTLVHNQTLKDAIISKKKMDKEFEAADVSAEIHKHMYFHKRLLDGILDENLKKLVENEIRSIYLSQLFAMKNKDEEIRQLHSKLSQANKNIGSLNTSLIIAANFTRILACPANIRFTLEIASTMMQSLSSKARRDAIILHLKNLTTTRTNNVIRAINHLSSLAYTYELHKYKSTTEKIREVSNTKKNYRMNFSEAFSILKSSFINTNVSKITNGTDIISLVHDLIDSADEDLAREKWNQEIMPKWKLQPEKVITTDECEDIRKLVTYSKEDLNRLQTNKNAPYFTSRKEVNYANAILELDCLYGNQYNSEIEKTCIWILYTETERPEVQRIVSNLEKDWSSQMPDESRRIGVFCSKWLQLYNAVSVAFHHKPTLYPALSECKPRSEDYEMFLEYLLIAYKDPFMIYAARSLMGITENYSTPNPK